MSDDRNVTESLISELNVMMVAYEGAPNGKAREDIVPALRHLLSMILMSAGQESLAADVTRLSVLERKENYSRVFRNCSTLFYDAMGDAIFPRYPSLNRMRIFIRTHILGI